jgi:hypothetical protein
VCLTAIEPRGRRPLPSGLGGPADDQEAPLVAEPGVPWLEPFPGALLAVELQNPASVAVSRSGIRLAFVAALQYLSARHPAVLILRDVLDWPAAEVADLLGTTTTAVNSGAGPGGPSVAPLSKGLELLDSAVSHALASAALGTAQLLRRPTPCLGWDISVACGACRPVPPGLAAVLLPIAPLLITPGTRPGLFADPVRLPGPASPGDQLVAFLGREPCRLKNARARETRHDDGSQGCQA